jgi:hypothetical protein
MLFESTAILLHGIVNSLDDCRETRWDDDLESGNQCLYELHQMARSSNRKYRLESDAKFQVGAPAFQRAMRAIPHVKSMVRSIRRMDQAGAVESGRAAIAEMNGAIDSRPSVPAIAPSAGNKPPVDRPEAPAIAVHRHKKPAPKGRAAIAVRKPARASAAS